MEYSIWHQKVTVWSTPYGNIYSQMELILKHSIRHQKCARWSTPYGHYLMPYGVLHTVTIYCLMEYSIWSLWSSHFHVDNCCGQLFCYFCPHLSHFKFDYDEIKEKFCLLKLYNLNSHLASHQIVSHNCFVTILCQ